MIREYQHDEILYRMLLSIESDHDPLVLLKLDDAGCAYEDITRLKSGATPEEGACLNQLRTLVYAVWRELLDYKMVFRCPMPGKPEYQLTWQGHDQLDRMRITERAKART